MKKDDVPYLLHIRDAVQRIEKYLHSVSYCDFMEHDLLQAGVIREIEIIGEVTKRLSETIKTKYPDIPWRKIAGMRDKLIHDYMGVDMDAVWDTVEKDLPRLKEMILMAITHEGGP